MDLFNFIKQNVDILSVIGDYTSLKKTGSMYWKARCPFHQENTPSFTVSPHKNIFYCFGCHATGDVINFVEKIEHLSAFEAAQHLANRFQLQIPKEVSASFAPQLNKTHFQLCHAVAAWCQTMLNKHQQALNYLQQRNLTNITLSQFLIGYFPASTRGVGQLLSHIAPLGFTSQDLINAHILFTGKQGLYSPFEDRIMFPIKDHLGQVCGFGGRIFLPHDTRPKYYNSMESDYFKKGKILFGFDVAKSEIQKQQAAIIVEGYTDCIAMHQQGFKNTVATLGTACTTEHLSQLAKHAPKIYLLYDADNAGKQAMLRITTLCWQQDLDPMVVSLPAGQDPASMLTQHQSITPYLQQAQDIFQFFLNAKAGNFQQESTKQKMAIVDELFELIRQLTNSFKQNLLLIKISETLKIPLEIIKTEYTKRYENHKVPIQPTTKPAATFKAQHEKLEEQILATVMLDPNLLTEKYETLLTTGLSEKSLNIVQKILEHQRLHRDNSKQLDLQAILEPAQLQEIQGIMFHIDTTQLTTTFKNLMAQFQKKYWKTVVGNIKVKIQQAQTARNLQEVTRLMALFEELKAELYTNGRL